MRPRDLVPGDIIALEAGNVVPADLRLIESANLRVQEAALTGESEPVEKETAALAKDDLPLGDRRNMAYMGTQVTYGRGVAVVVATGMRTELGTIANLLQNVQHSLTPLQQRLDGVGKQLAVAGVVVALLVMGLGIALGETLADMALTAISVAVAVIPEGLPAVVTFTLALGAQRMLRRNALVRKLPAVETLGSVTTICSDKTGTLTENRMTVTVLEVAGHRVDLPPPAAGELVQPDVAVTGLRSDVLGSQRLLLAAGALCNDASLQRESGDERYTVLGDPTEGALLVAALQGGMSKHTLEAALPRVAELPFDSDRKRMTTVHRRPEQGLNAELTAAWGVHGYAPEAPFIAITKGAVDGLLDLATHVWTDDGAVPLDTSWRQRIDAANDALAQNGMRVLGVAFRPVNNAEQLQEIERELIIVGLQGMIDPPRPEVRDAVATCRAAGIRPVMITGDHPLTAGFIARDLGIAQDGTVVTGAQLSAMSEAELSAVAARASVFARVSPEHKLKIVEALRSQGQVVAMTGDGVNDAPALKKADIGVAMGITGTDVSKEASDMVLRDDNFATIVAAVEEGRVIYDNLRRFVKFAVAGNIGKVLVMLLWPLVPTLLGLPLAAVALLPLQLLWLNLLTDGLLGLSMGVEPAEKNVMRRPPHKPTDGIFSGGLGWQTAWTGIVIGALSLAVGAAYYAAGLAQWQTMIFTTLAFLQVFQALATRSNTESLFAIGMFGNRVMWAIIGLVVGLQLVAIYTPLNLFLGLVPLTGSDLLLSLGIGAVLLVAIEVEKVLMRGRRSQKQAAELA
jgi:P-type Ca2+ transporter type 2C